MFFKALSSIPPNLLATPKHFYYVFQLSDKVFLTVFLSSQTQAKTTPELYYLSVLLSVSSLVSTGKRKAKNKKVKVTYPYQRLKGP